MSNEEADWFIIDESEAGERLDKILATRLKEAGSRTYFQFLIQEEKILLNGAPVKKRIKPKAGDEIDVEYILTPELTLKPENIPLEIVYEDEFLLVVNKPAGMVVHPAPGHWSGTFVNALLYHCRSLEPLHELRPGIVHRLDKDTSGLLIAAKTAQTQKALIDMFAGRRIQKEYLALCIGNTSHCTIHEPIGRHPVNRKQMAVVKEGGRSAVTSCKTLFFDGKISLVQIGIETGRTHQIRVHMKHHGTPVLGDTLYGLPKVNLKYAADRQMLHASFLKFTHPENGKILEFKSAPPRDMEMLIKKIRNAT